MIAFIETVFNAVCTLSTKVGSAVRTFASTLVTKFPSVVEMVSKIANVFVSVAQSLGVLNSSDDALTLGAKVKQEDTRERMEGESMEDYFTYLREEVALDEDALSVMTESEKTECEIVGTSMIVESISENTGVKISPDFLASVAKIEMSAARLEAYIDSFRKTGFESMDFLTGFLEEKLSDNQMAQVYNIVESVEKFVKPELDEDSLLEIVDGMKQAVNTD